MGDQRGPNGERRHTSIVVRGAPRCIRWSPWAAQKAWWRDDTVEISRPGLGLPNNARSHSPPRQSRVSSLKSEVASTGAPAAPGVRLSFLAQSRSLDLHPPATHTVHTVTLAASTEGKMTGVLYCWCDHPVR